MSDLVVALGLVLVIEGAFYALAPLTVKKLAALAVETHEQQLRIGGLVAIAFGFGIVWIVRSF